MFIIFSSPSLSFISLHIRVLTICWYINTISSSWLLLKFSSWLVWLIRDWHFECWSLGHLSHTVQLYKCHMLSNWHYFDTKYLVPLITDLHCFLFVPVWKWSSSLHSVAESGNKSIKAWLSSKDCVRLGSRRKEPTLPERKKLFFQDQKTRYR